MLLIDILFLPLVSWCLASKILKISTLFQPKKDLISLLLFLLHLSLHHIIKTLGTGKGWSSFKNQNGHPFETFGSKQSELEHIYPMFCPFQQVTMPSLPVVRGALRLCFTIILGNTFAILFKRMDCHSVIFFVNLLKIYKSKLFMGLQTYLSFRMKGLFTVSYLAFMSGRDSSNILIAPLVFQEQFVSCGMNAAEAQSCFIFSLSHSTILFPHFSHFFFAFVQPFKKISDHSLLGSI